MASLRTGTMLARVRDEKLYLALGHPDVEDYADKRLQLGRSSLYRYLQIHDWVLKNHPGWLQKKPEGFIPDMNDVAILIGIDRDLSKKNVSPQKRKKLDDLKNKVMTQGSKRSELAKIRTGNGSDINSLKSFLEEMQKLRSKGGKLSGLPEEVITYLDAAIGVLTNEHTVARLTRTSFGDLLSA